MKPKTRVTVAHVKAPPKATERVFPFSDKVFTSSDASTHLALPVLSPEHIGTLKATSENKTHTKKKVQIAPLISISTYYS